MPRSLWRRINDRNKRKFPNRAGVMGTFACAIQSGTLISGYDFWGIGWDANLHKAFA